MPYRSSLKTTLLSLQQQAENKNLSCQEILDILATQGPTVAIILLSLPFCLPIQIPGLSTPFGLMIASLGIQMLLGKKLWLPKKMLSRKISSSFLLQVTAKVQTFLATATKWIHPRCLWVFCVPSPVHGGVICLLGCLLALPLPIPFTNLVTAWPLCLLSLGILERDGLFVLIGYSILPAAGLVLCLLF